MTARASFTQADVTRALKGAKAAAMEIGGFRVAPTGEIVVFAKEASQAAGRNPLDDLLLNGR
jgi:hypothetical protein